MLSCLITLAFDSKCYSIFYPDLHLVCYTAVFSVLTQRSFPQTAVSAWGGALRDDSKNGCVAD